MSDNILQTLQKLVQDVIAPDVRELKVRVVEKDMEVRFNAVDLRFNGIDPSVSTRWIKSSTTVLMPWTRGMISNSRHSWRRSPNLEHRANWQRCASSLP